MLNKIVKTIKNKLKQTFIPSKYKTGQILHFWKDAEVLDVRFDELYSDYFYRLSDSSLWLSQELLEFYEIKNQKE